MTDPYIEPKAALQRLIDEYDKHGSLYIGFDFDGTVHDYHKKGYTFPNVIKLLQDLKKIGCKLICWTAYQNLDFVNNYLLEHHIPFDSINDGGVPMGYETKKPFFNALLDDRSGLDSVYRDLTAFVQYVESKKGEEIPMVQKYEHVRKEAFEYATSMYWTKTDAQHFALGARWYAANQTEEIQLFQNLDKIIKERENVINEKDELLQQYLKTMEVLAKKNYELTQQLKAEKDGQDNYLLAYRRILGGMWGESEVYGYQEFESLEEAQEKMSKMATSYMSSETDVFLTRIIEHKKAPRP